MSNKIDSRRTTDEIIVYLRALAIILIVFHHSLMVFSGWPPSDLCEMGLSPIFSTMSFITKDYGLAIFTFISGYLLCYGKKQFNLLYVYKKGKKILFPCAIAAIAYYLLFPQFMNNNNPVNGTHLWYLPMIFLFYLLKPIAISNNVKVFALGLLLTLVILYLGGHFSHIRTFYECQK